MPESVWRRVFSGPILRHEAGNQLMPTGQKRIYMGKIYILNRGRGELSGQVGQA